MTTATAELKIEDFYTEPFPGRKGSERIFETCGKCSGSGVVNFGRVTLVRGNVSDRFCFDCGGTGRYSYLVSSRRATERNRAKKAIERELRLRELTAERDAFAAENAETLALVREWAPKDRFLADLLNTLDNAGGILSEGQLAAVAPAVERIKAREAAARPVPVTSERIRVEGRVVSKKWVENDFGGSLKMLVECDGFKLWGSVPRGLGAEVDARVAFMAKVEPSSDDESFGFYSRPTKPERLA